jgi:hypothetical protein
MQGHNENKKPVPNRGSRAKGGQQEQECQGLKRQSIVGERHIRFGHWVCEIYHQLHSWRHRRIHVLRQDYQSCEMREPTCTSGHLESKLKEK